MYYAAPSYEFSRREKRRRALVLADARRANSAPSAPSALVSPTAIIASDYPKIVVPLVEAATRSIDIIIYDWRWYPTVSGSSVSRFNDAIVAASRRGVDVRALVSSEAVLARLKGHGISARLLHSKKLLHTKMLLLDRTGLVIGSHNFTQNAFSYNEEASVFVSLGSEDNSFVKYFDTLWGL